MRIYIKFEINKTCKKILEDQLQKLGLEYSLISFGEVDLKSNITSKQIQEINTGLQNYGIEIIESPKNILIQKIKDTVIEMVYMDEKLPTFKTSTYLAEKLNHRYGYISKMFSEITFTSIENYIILQKIERAKELITITELTFTEIAWQLNFSSMAHFSNQFKSTTGLTPSAFQRIMQRKKENILEEK